MSAVAKVKSFTRADGSPRRVLYAEDQTSSRIVTTAMLKRMGFEVDAVEDGELAVQAARTENYDVILLDIEMPVMDGVTAARSIRSEIKHCDDTPILALSAFLADSTEQCVWRDAFDSALPKPANTNELHQALTDAMGMKDRNANANQKVSAQFNAEEMLCALKTTLSRGTWERLQITAAGEMHHLANAMGAAILASDQEALIKCHHALKVLALNFGASAVLEKSQTLRDAQVPPAMTDLLHAIGRWKING
jgi:CheY-like chemotaxis protein